MICEITSENSQPATEKYYAWGLDLSQSLQGTGGIGGLIATLDNSASVVYYYFYDANGNVGQLANATDGSIAAHYEYDPFGNIIKSEGEYKDSNPYRFSTKYFDAETGFLYYGFRFYSPTLGRWISRDPIEENGGENLYGFVFNNPVSLIDILGREANEYVDITTNSLAGFSSGAGKAAFQVIYEPLAMVYDLEMIAYYTIIANPDKFEATSGVGEAAMSGSGSLEIIGGMAVGIVMVPVEYGAAIFSGDPERIGSATFNIESFLFASSRFKLSTLAKNRLLSAFQKFLNKTTKACNFLIRKKVVTPRSVDPGKLKLPPTRPYGADPFKLVDQMKKYGDSTQGMKAIQVTKGAKGELMINDGVTRATRIDTYNQMNNTRQCVKIEIIEETDYDFSQLPTVRKPSE
ncbi:MAG: RHS repeat-associated core domain-containing protein [Desulfobacterales bacterium]|nr:RHS repeat-associated core domain-containing protein [Desulfobacterales bacterium]